MKEHHPTKCIRAQFWDAGELECPCTCPKGWPRAVKQKTEAQRADDDYFKFGTRYPGQ